MFQALELWHAFYSSTHVDDMQRINTSCRYYLQDVPKRLDLLGKNA
jgi:hypothetical protein